MLEGHRSRSPICMAQQNLIDGTALALLGLQWSSAEADTTEARDATPPLIGAKQFSFSSAASQTWITAPCWFFTSNRKETTPRPGFCVGRFCTGVTTA